MGFQYKHDCLKVLSELDTKIHQDLYNLTMELDKTIKDETFLEVWTLQFYDENEGNTYIELFTDERVAKDRFYEVMKQAFDYDIKKLGNVEWKNIYDFESDDFYFTKDAYKNHYLTKSAKGDYGEDWRYPKYTWKCGNLNYYSELMLKKTKVNKPFIFVKEDKEGTEKN